MASGPYHISFDLSPFWTWARHDTTRVFSTAFLGSGSYLDWAHVTLLWTNNEWKRTLVSPWQAFLFDGRSGVQLLAYWLQGLHPGLCFFFSFSFLIIASLPRRYLETSNFRDTPLVRNVRMVVGPWTLPFCIVRRHWLAGQRGQIGRGKIRQGVVVEWELGGGWYGRCMYGNEYTCYTLHMS